jgi:hypothetical protein
VLFAAEELSMSPLKSLLPIAAFLVLPLSISHADTLWIGDTTVARAIKSDNVKVTAVKDDTVNYTSDTGMQAKQPLKKLVQINIDGESAFNTAENAYGTGDFDSAITNYQQVLQSASSKDWMQSRAASRLIAAAKSKNRYDAEVSAYCSLLVKDPTAAAANKPGSPPEHSQYLDSALTSVGKTLDAGNLNATQKSTLLTLQLEIDRAKGDKAAVNATLGQLVAMGAADPGVVAMLKIASANVDLDAKNYEKAITDIDTNRALFTEPDQQVDALYVLAQAHNGVDGNTNDAEKLKDLAIGYMRVVTFGGKLPDRPHVADSLVAAAEIETKLNEKAAAIQLYQQVVKEKAFAGTPASTRAQAALAASSKEGPSAK